MDAYPSGSINTPPRTDKIDHSHIGYPPGGLLLWIIIMLELITFGLGIAMVIYYGAHDPDAFASSSLHLNRGIGTLNTLILLVSGFWMASAVQSVKSADRSRAHRLLILTILGGLAFTVLKGFEYSEKLAAGITLGGNMFETLYWLLTGFHLIHVWVGMVILGVIAYRVRKVENQVDVLDVESGGAFWHMCDLIWLFLFPSLYLLF